MNKPSQVKIDYSSKRLKCPVCESLKAFAPAKGHEETLDKGKCFSCGKFIAPKDDNWKHTQQAPAPKRPIPPLPEIIKSIPSDDVVKTLATIEESPLFKYFSLYIAPKELSRHFKAWNIGYENGQTCFWYLDKNGTARNCKIITYKKDGHRDKKIYPRFKYKGYPQILFGLDKLVPGKIVCLIESEKTALIQSHLIPEYNWIATGGSQGLTTEKAKALKGFFVHYLPDGDSGGKSGAQKVAERLNEAGISFKISKSLDNITDHSDVLDHFIDPQYWSVRDTEVYEERIAIMMYDGNCTEEVSVRGAYTALNRWRKKCRKN